MLYRMFDCLLFFEPFGVKLICHCHQNDGTYILRLKIKCLYCNFPSCWTLIYPIVFLARWQSSVIIYWKETRAHQYDWSRFNTNDIEVPSSRYIFERERESKKVLRQCNEKQHAPAFPRTQLNLLFFITEAFYWIQDSYIDLIQPPWDHFHKNTQPKYKTSFQSQKHTGDYQPEYKYKEDSEAAVQRHLILFQNHDETLQAHTWETIYIIRDNSTLSCVVRAPAVHPSNISCSMLSSSNGVTLGGVLMLLCSKYSVKVGSTLSMIALRSLLLSSGSGTFQSFWAE